MEEKKWNERYKEEEFAYGITALISCKKEINVDLQNASSQIVIEGVVTNTSHAEVTFSKSDLLVAVTFIPKFPGRW